MLKIQEIYRCLIQSTDYMVELTNKTEEKIIALLKEEAQGDRREYEKYRDDLFSAAAVAEEAGFVKGFRYAVELMAECVSDHCDISEAP